MGIESIGNIISKLRKEKGVTQEELSKYTCVSTQAVSKWENGGLPDTELLPKIADFFEVSIDELFGRSITDYSDIENALIKKIGETTDSERFKLAFELSWVIEKALIHGKSGGESIEKIQAEIGDNLLYSSIRSDDGYTLMGISKILPYFLIVPECADVQKAYFKDIDYMLLFKDLSDKVVFDTIVFLDGRELEKGFTPNLLVKNFNIEYKEAEKVINILRKYRLIVTSKVEIDDIEQEIYTFQPDPSFSALLIFAREMIARTNSYCYFSACRKKSYFS